MVVNLLKKIKNNLIDTLDPRVAKKISSEGFKTAKNKFRLNETINGHEKEYLKCLRSWHKKM